MYGWTPTEIAQLTPEQQLAMLDNVKTDTRTGRKTRQFSNLQEAREFMRAMG